MVLEAYSVSHGKASAYLPVTELLKGYFEITSEDEERKRREKITGKVLTLDRALQDTPPELRLQLHERIVIAMNVEHLAKGWRGEGLRS